MNNVERVYRESETAVDFAEGYLGYLTNLLAALDREEIAALIDEIEHARRHGNTIFVVGNGGSAASASHMVNDLGVGVLKNAQTDDPIRIMALTDNIASMTAIANDSGYENIFLQQLHIRHYTD